MSTPKERLLAAVDRLCSDVEAAVLSHHDLHTGEGSAHTGATPSTAAKKIDPAATATISVATSTACEPAATGSPGRVRVAVLPVTHDRPLAGMAMARVAAGSLQVQVYDAACENPLPAHQGHVDVAVPVDHPIGAYVGAVTEAGGKLIAPVVVYLDGL